MHPLLQPSVSATIKLSSPATREFWEIPILYEDAHLLALDKPSGLLTSPDRSSPDRASLTKLLHAGIERGTPWAREGGRNYLMPAHRLDLETSGVLLLAKSKPVLVTLVNWFSAENPGKKHLALAQGSLAQDSFKVEAKLSPHPVIKGLMRVDPKGGKHSVTVCEVRERFAGFALVQCELLTDRAHQVRVHLRHAGLAVVGDQLYGGRPLLLSDWTYRSRWTGGGPRSTTASSRASPSRPSPPRHGVAGGPIPTSAFQAARPSSSSGPGCATPAPSSSLSRGRGPEVLRMSWW